MTDEIFFSHDDMRADESVRLDRAIVADLRRAFDDGIGADGDARAELRRAGNNGARVNHARYIIPASRKLK